MHYPYTLKVNRLTVPMHLGVPDEERVNPQEVEVSLWLHFAHPLSCWEEDAAGFVNYDDLCKATLAFAASREFKLIEHFTCALHAHLRELLAEILGEGAQGVPLSIKMHKPNLPVAHRVQGSSFYYSDLPAETSVSGVFE